MSKKWPIGQKGYFMEIITILTIIIWMIVNGEYRAELVIVCGLMALGLRMDICTWKFKKLINHVDVSHVISDNDDD